LPGAWSLTVSESVEAPYKDFSEVVVLKG